MEAWMPGAPRCVVNIVLMEAMERFAYYGFRAILARYFTEVLGFDETWAIAAFSFTSAIAYTSPVGGAWLADGLLGKYRTIVVLGSVYAVGLWGLVWSAYAASVGGSACALLLVGVGTGGIKPCVSAFGADQFRGENSAALRRYFAVFYAAINVGSVASFVLTPLVRARFGYAAAFSLPATLVVCALASFVAARKSYYVVRKDTTVCTTLRLVVDPTSRGGDDAAALRRVFGILATLPVFWALFDQQGSVWVMQAKDMRTGGLQPEQLGVFNPLFVLALLPFFEKVAYPSLEKRLGRPVTAPRRMAAGMAFASASFFAAAIVEAALPLYILWQLPQIFLITVAEILVSVTGLEYSYRAAPPKFKSLVQSAFLLTTALGDLFDGILYAALGSTASRAAFMILCASLMLANLALFARVAAALTDQPLFFQIPVRAGSPRPLTTRDDDHDLDDDDDDDDDQDQNQDQDQDQDQDRRRRHRGQDEDCMASSAGPPLDVALV
ncbi:hypothetical protein CTAYLR_001029 [Chrysophaeum taylorii]|uniref:Peptide transporter n=1 Tax=Chrysophaeum taylorii TaxID=2483200 RepID=A0AAD7XMV2_9STRA|nr:hypothetical protein CTAYLR_001029 [Chrysophaeum taylorii]